MSDNPERPECVKEEHLNFLDSLRESGAINMFLAGSVLKEQFPDLTMGEARKVHMYWMETFGTRKKEEKDIGSAVPSARTPLPDPDEDDDDSDDWDEEDEDLEEDDEEEDEDDWEDEEEDEDDEDRY